MKSNIVLTVGIAIVLLSVGCLSPHSPAGLVWTDVTVHEVDFMQTPNITREVTMTTKELHLFLPATPSTGFEWPVEAEISDTSVLKQVGHGPRPVSTPPVTVYGAPEEWDFDALKAGTATISMDYRKDGVGGEEGVRTFKLTVTVVRGKS